MARSVQSALQYQLKSYLHTALVAEAGLSQSAVLEGFPDPTVDLELSKNRVVVAIELQEQVRDRQYLGGYRYTRATPTSGVNGLIRYEGDSLRCGLVVALWASTKAMRDDVDLILDRLLNQPYWSTVTPLADTALNGAVVGSTVAQWITVDSVADIWTGTRLEVGSGASRDVFDVLRVDTALNRVFGIVKHSHVDNSDIYEVKHARRNVGVDLSLRLSEHYNVIGRYNFGPSSALNLAQLSQKSEYRSLRTGVGEAVEIREFTGVLRQAEAIAITDMVDDSTNTF